MKTFREFLIEGRGFEYQGSKYSSGFGRYTKDGESISREEYMKASDAYKGEESVGVSPTKKVSLAPKKIKSKVEPSSLYGGIKPVFGDIIPNDVAIMAEDDDKWKDFLRDETKTINLRNYVKSLTGLTFDNGSEFYNWCDRNSANVGAGGQHFMEIIQKNVARERKLDAMLYEAKIDPVQFKKDVDEAIKKYTSNDAELCVRVMATSLSKILKDGRFKSQFETKTSRGMFNLGVRSNVEAVGQGLKYKTKKADRPIYGTLKHTTYMDDGTVDLDEYGGSDNAYGNMCVVLKSDSLRERTSICFGDSFCMRAVSSPLDNPSYKSLLYRLSGEARDIDIKDFYEQLKENPEQTIGDAVMGDGLSYPEVQIHGGVKTEDIAYVKFKGYRSTIPQKVVSELEKAGIKFVFEEGY